ncbi:MAG: dehydrogenase [Candidatus Lindowbacteria bacterium RIFCSPLOWO2_12_FULL_62_27]|nr:MAG: dehydrogenase [Candidatus Lindowbacteria bacterium RIFCSPLOWO2_02_FULL_62_12]OGH60222.1 MAG: dehydrogenase [Candidatus Lindowbacteria bacterium RIFCSPLOWO2_12_FULL_62_27]
MKAAIMVEQRKPLVVDEVQMPADLLHGQVLVKIHYTGICGSQVNEMRGLKGPDKFLPHLLGHEGGGVVQACGPGVKAVKAGDRVVLHWRKGEGIQSDTPRYQWKGNRLNAGWVTTFNEMAIVSENRVTPVPADLNLKSAVLYGCALTTGFGIVQNEARMKTGESIVVYGSGGVGLSVILAASLVSAHPIVAVDLQEVKLKKALEYGATHVIDASKEDARKRLESLFPTGADVVVETIGANPIKELAYDLTSATGRTVLVGVTKAGDRMALDTTPLHFGKKLVPSYGGSSNPSYEIPRLIRLQRSGRFSLDGMISHEFSLDEINDAIDLMVKGTALRCVINMER